MLIGIGGKAAAGKDTIGDYLVHKYGFNKIALADPIKRLVKDVFALDDHTVYDRVAREQALEQWGGWSVRKLLQYVGTELFRENIDEEIWVKSLWYRIRDDVATTNYVVTDIRFPNEMNFFKQHAPEGQFVMFKVIRDDCKGNVGLSGHRSESYELQADYDIYNDGTVKELYNKVYDIFSEDLVFDGGK